MGHRNRENKYSREMNEHIPITDSPHSSESADFEEDTDDDDFLEPDDDDDDESAEVDISEPPKKSSEPLITNESHNPILEASLEKALDAEEAGLPNFLTPGGKVFEHASDAAIVDGKAARIAADCSKAELRAPCSAGRKWKCVLIHGRWRRQKCRYETELNLQQPKMSTKKCACFTPGGLVYTRLETDGNIARRPTDTQKENSTRIRRSIDNEVFEPNTVDSILKENPSIGHLSFKNDPEENEDTKDKIDKLIEETEAFLQVYERTKEDIEHKRVKRKAQHWNHGSNHKHKKNNAVVNSNESSLECKIEKDGTVNCSQIIYNDLKAWHTNRLSLEDQIRQLRTKLEDLKEIKRHLKTTKPVVELQSSSIRPIVINNHLLNTTHHNNSKEHFRKARLHKGKPKHRNSMSSEKKLRQSNEYLLPTAYSKIKQDIFEIQQKNETKIEATTQIPITTSETEEALNTTGIKPDIPKPQVTTIITEGNYYDQKLFDDDKSTIQSVITTDTATTEFTRIFDITTKTAVEDNNTEAYVSQKVQFFSSTIDKILATEKSTSKSTPSTTTTTSTPSTTTDATAAPVVPLNLGPARLDASEYEQINPNKGTSKNMGIFDKPVDVFQRRLHPLFIENEDKHVCYCEESRKTRGPGHSYLEAAQKAREEQRKRKAQLLQKKLRKARKRAELEKLCESERMNCYRHDNEHWRTAPFWTAGPFCFCMSTSNNTYNCVRTINATHNLLYCEFITGLVTYYNLRIDPFETQNRVKYLTAAEREYFHNQLQQLLSCRGPSCRRFSHSNPMGSSEETGNRRLDDHVHRGESIGYNERSWRWPYGRRYARARELHRRSRHMVAF